MDLSLVSDRTEPDMSFELFEPDKSPVQLNPDFCLEPLSWTFCYLGFKKHVPPSNNCISAGKCGASIKLFLQLGIFYMQIPTL